jgi:hypothetical protein
MFIGWAAVYPASLHLVSLSCRRKSSDEEKRRGLALVCATVCCACALFWRLQPRVVFDWGNPVALLVHTVPFLTCLIFNPPSWPVVDFWMLRDCFVAPVIEELYYRQLLPMLAPKPQWLWSTVAFALAHVLGTQGGGIDWNEAMGKLVVTFAFGCLQHLLLAAQTSTSTNSFQVSIGGLGCLAFAHGLANFVGIPMLLEEDEHRAKTRTRLFLVRMQQLVLFIFYPFVLFVYHFTML